MTTTIDLAYGIGVTDKIACNYEESTMRVGSMVYIRDTSPECCCPPVYNNEMKTGASAAPRPRPPGARLVRFGPR